jgi:hypothetical protein
VVVVQLWAAGRNQVVELLVAYQVVELLLVVANKVLVFLENFFAFLLGLHLPLY